MVNYACVYIEGKKLCMAVKSGHKKNKKKKKKEDALIKGETTCNGPRGYLYSQILNSI